MEQNREALKHLKPVSRMKSNVSVKFLNAGAYPGNHCPMHTALALSAKIKGLSTLLIGTAECTTYARMVIPEPTGEHGECHWMYLLDSHEVVFGCRKGIIDAIHQMNQEGPEAILIILTCVPEVIGEDIEGIIHEIQPQVNARLTFVLMGHFKCNSYPSGSWKTLLALGGLMEGKEIDPHAVNILGYSPSDNHAPAPAVLSALSGKGYTLRFLAPDTSLHDFLEAPKARLNIVFSVYMEPLAQYMEKEFSIPYVSLHNAYKVSDIDYAYSEIGRQLSVDLLSGFAAEREKALAFEKEASCTYSGLKFVCGNIGSLMPVPFALYLVKLGMKPLILHIEEVYPDDRIYAKELCQMGYDPPACHMVNGPSDVKVLERLCPDICFGIFTGVRPCFPCVGDMYELYGVIGYERTTMLFEKIRETFHQNISCKERNMNGTA